MLGDKLTHSRVIDSFPFNVLSILQLYSWMMVKRMHNLSVSFCHLFILFQLVCSLAFFAYKSKSSLQVHIQTH